MTTIYQFKPWARLRGDPQKVGEAIETLREAHGTVSPALVVDNAREPESVLHPFFEWHDGEAAEKYRETQAAHLLRSIVVVRTEGVDIKAPIRAFVSIRAAATDAAEDTGDDEQGTYTSIASAMRVVRYREQLMRDALRDLDAYRMKYQLLSDVSGFGAALAEAREALQRIVDAAQEREAA
jgi:hypothetical protein